MPIAPAGGLSPFSTTSMLWSSQWPIKPEIVMEGGNVIEDSGFFSDCNEMSILSTYYKPTEWHFYPFKMTSASTAQASWFAAQIQTKYPSYWPETIRALMIHSAEWTERMKQQFLETNGKSSYRELVRTCGYGVPNLERALFSSNNSLTLIAESEIQPYKKKSGRYVTKEMNLHELPWPKDVLENLPVHTRVKMRVTLSYFIEPSPGERGWKNKYSYSSHGLRFYLNSPGEDIDSFQKRINKAAREDSQDGTATKSPADYWTLGRLRDTGSVHSDIWTGYASELASSNLIAVSPVVGWWRERHKMGRWKTKTRYSLIVSIETPIENIDIYTPVKNQIDIPVVIEI